MSPTKKNRDDEGEEYSDNQYQTQTSTELDRERFDCRMFQEMNSPSNCDSYINNKIEKTARVGIIGSKKSSSLQGFQQFKQVLVMENDRLKTTKKYQDIKLNECFTNITNLTN